MKQEFFKITSKRITQLISQKYTFEKLFVFTVGVFLVLFSFLVPAVRTGDGHYYFAMLHGIATNASPELSQDVIDFVSNTLHLEIKNTRFVNIGEDGRLYAWHFFFYSLLCLPAYALLNILGLDGLKAFQVTNAVIIILSISYILIYSSLSRVVRWILVLGFLLSSGVFYFQWTHPEVLTASVILIASVFLLEKKYYRAVLFVAVASLQNPSAILMIIPIVFSMTYYKVSKQHLLFFSKQMLMIFFMVFSISLIAFIPIIWNFTHFGVANPIAASGYIDYKNIDIDRTISFFFDLNQGLIVGQPFLIWVVPLLLYFRVAHLLRKKQKFWKEEDLLILGFLFMVIPTLAQSNWNGGNSVFLRYAAWSSMALLAWVSVGVVYLSKKERMIVLLPALSIQLIIVYSMGGLYVINHPSYLQLSTLTEKIWSISPHLYNPEPDIFYERVSNREMLPPHTPEQVDNREMLPPKTPIVYQNKQGQILRILTKSSDFSYLSKYLCGAGGTLISTNNRSIEDAAHVTPTKHGYYYVTGNFACKYTLPLALSAGESNFGSSVFATGWGHPETWGIWSLGDGAQIKLQLLPEEHKGQLTMEIFGMAYVSKRHTRQQIDVYVKNTKIDSWVVEYPNNILEKKIQINTPSFVTDGSIQVDFKFLNAVSPATLGDSQDTRKLALGISRIKVSKSENTIKIDDKE